MTKKAARSAVDATTRALLPILAHKIEYAEACSGVVTLTIEQAATLKNALLDACKKGGE